MLTRRAALMAAAGTVALPILANAAKADETMATSDAAPVDLSTLERVKHRLVRPPMVHVHDQVAPGAPRIVEFEMRIVEKEVEVGNGAYLQAMTFNGSIPGPLMVVHEGDYGRCCTKGALDSQLESNVIAGGHEHTRKDDLQDDELA